MSDKLSYDEIMEALDQADSFDIVDEVERRGYQVVDEDVVTVEDADDSVLIEELKSRGYYVGNDAELIAAIHRWERGDKKEALILIEREVPELFGLSKLAD